jgi:hypothetical protein
MNHEEDDQITTIKLFKKVFENKDGEAVLEQLMGNCHVLDGTFSEDPYKMYYNEGRRSVIFEILTMINTDVIKYRKMLESMANPEE